MMYRNLYYLFVLAALLPSCSNTTPRIFVVCEENNVGNSIVQWKTQPALQGQVKVFASTDPENIPETTPVASANIADQWTVVVNNDPSKRYYYTLLFDNRYRAHVASRNINMPGTQNFRDLGGYPVYPRHKRIRWGMLYRSAQMDLSNPATVQKLQNLGIRTIIDLRDSTERTPNSLPPDTGLREVNIPIQAGSLKHILEGINSHSICSDTVYRIVERINRHIVSQHASDFRRMFDILSERQNYPVVIHCTTGKGRTGIASALILAALGVNDEIIMDDYCLSKDFFNITTAASYAYHLPASSQEAITTVYSARENFLNAAKDEIERRYGSVDNYLQYAVGLQKKDLKQLRDILLVKDEERVHIGTTRTPLLLSSPALPFLRN